MDIQRRRLLIGMGSALLATPSWAAPTIATPRQMAGPFYPTDIPLDDDNDLTQVGQNSERAQGEVSDLHGRILDINGKPLSKVKVEIWQCDANGRYRHPRDSGGLPIDPNFQGHGHHWTNHAGQFRFRTIRPVAYPGRTPHIHVAVFAPGERPFVTQLYVAGEPQNANDFLYQRIPSEKRALVTAEFKPATAPTSNTPLEAKIDLILDWADATPTQS